MHVPDNLIENMRSRVALCRRLAAATHDSEVSELLLKMADDGEADIAKLEAEQDGSN